MTKFCVLNSSFPVRTEIELDDYVDFRQGLDSCFNGEKMVKKCISWHSLAAAYESEFFVYKKQGWEGCLKYDNILVLIREDLEHIEPLIKKLKLMKKKVGIGWHESGFQLANTFQDLNFTIKFKEICNMADYYWNINHSLEDFFNCILDVPVFTSFQAYPYDWAKQFIVSKDDRKGIILGTRTLSQFTNRYTMFAIGMANKIAKEKNTFVTYLNCDNIKNELLQDFFNKMGFDNVKIQKGPLEYHEWLKLIAKHEILFHCDNNQTAGQVVLDAGMVDVASVGGNTDADYLMIDAKSLRYSYFQLADFFEYFSDYYKIMQESAIERAKKVTSFENIKFNQDKFFETLK